MPLQICGRLPCKAIVTKRRGMQDVNRKNASPSTSLINPSLAVHTLLWFSPPSFNIEIPKKQAFVLRKAVTICVSITGCYRLMKLYFIFFVPRRFLKMSEICPSCDSAVYSAEKAAISGKNGEVWHKQCMKCSTCKVRLDSITFNEHKGKISVYITCF